MNGQPDVREMIEQTQSTEAFHEVRRELSIQTKFTSPIFHGAVAESLNFLPVMNHVWLAFSGNSGYRSAGRSSRLSCSNGDRDVAQHHPF